MDRIRASWTELVEPQWKTGISFADNEQNLDMFIKVPNSGNASTLVNTIYDILGVSYVDGTVVRSVDQYPLDSGGQLTGPAWNAVALHRITPARHPRCTWLRAKRVAGVVGIGQNNRRAVFGNGSWGDLDYWVIHIEFEAPIHQVLDDAQSPIGGIGQLPEYRRWTEWDTKPNVENITRPGISWSFVNLGINPRAFAGNRLIRTTKTQVTVLWKNVPADFICRDRVISPSISLGVGHVNMFPFPKIPPIVGNRAAWQTGFQFPPGTLLMLPPELIPHTQLPTSASPNADVQGYVAKAYDVRFIFSYFDPPCALGNTVNGYKVKLNSTPPLNFPNQSQNFSTFIRGHNLFPTPTPITAFDLVLGQNVLYSWWPATNFPGGNVPAGDLPSDSYLLYQYYDFERLFQFGG